MNWLIKLLSPIFNTHVHVWGKWEPKSVSMGRFSGGTKLYDFTQYYQQRVCKTCGKIEQEEITYKAG